MTRGHLAHMPCLPVHTTCQFPSSQNHLDFCCPEIKTHYMPALCITLQMGKLVTDGCLSTSTMKLVRKTDLAVLFAIVFLRITKDWSMSFVIWRRVQQSKHQNLYVSFSRSYYAAICTEGSFLKANKWKIHVSRLKKIIINLIVILVVLFHDISQNLHKDNSLVVPKPNFHWLNWFTFV